LQTQYLNLDVLLNVYSKRSEKDLSEQKKWAKKLSATCGLDPKILETAMEELSESCYGDSRTAQKVIEELTMECRLNKEELSKFIKDVSKNCPIDIKKLHKEVNEAEGNKESAFEAINKAMVRPP